MRASYLKKTYVYITTVIILLLLYQVLKTVTYTNQIHREGNKLTVNRTVLIGEVNQTVKEENKSDLKYILQWTMPGNVPFVYMGKGQEGFIDRKCPYTNCFVTADRSYLGDYTKFDVIAFAGPEVIKLYDLPKMRSPHQKYVFATIESSENYPTCSNRFDGFFNWTWTFKLNSEVQWGYFAIRDKNNTKIGPKKQMHWIKLDDMDPVSEDFKNQLKTKTEAVAWFVSNCFTRSRREKYVNDLKRELSKYKMDVDVYGRCGTLRCSRDDEEACDAILEEKYYFYLSFENSFSEDYVTEKLLHGLENNVVPIVYGGANYTQYMPDGIYLNARQLNVEELATKINELINDPDKYSEYFRWKNHYSYHRLFKSVDTDPYCLFCTTLNNKEMVKKTTIYKDFRKWWDPPGQC